MYVCTMNKLNRIELKEEEEEKKRMVADEWLSIKWMYQWMYQWMCCCCSNESNWMNWIKWIESNESNATTLSSITSSSITTGTCTQSGTTYSWCFNTGTTIKGCHIWVWRNRTLDNCFTITVFFSLHWSTSHPQCTHKNMCQPHSHRCPAVAVVNPCHVMLVQEE